MMMICQRYAATYVTKYFIHDQRMYVLRQVERDRESNQQSDARSELYSSSVISTTCLSMWR